MKIHLFFGAVLLILTSCEQKLEMVENKNEEQQYIETYTIVKGGNTKQGPYVKKTLDGKLLEESTYENGMLEGKQKLYNKNVLYSTSIYQKGKLDGLYQTFYEGGQINVEGEYVQDVMSGKWKRYYPSGDLMEVVNFENNEENGPFVEFYPNGNIKAEGSYLNGDNEHGELFLYDINGILIKKMNCVEARCSTTWVKAGKEDWEGFRNDQ